MAKPAAKPGKKKVFKKKEKRIVPTGIVHVEATFNNTHVAITDTDGRVICWAWRFAARIQTLLILMLRKPVHQRLGLWETGQGPGIFAISRDEWLALGQPSTQS